jgi:hypothetical protein
MESKKPLPMEDKNLSSCDPEIYDLIQKEKVR